MLESARTQQSPSMSSRQRGRALRVVDATLGLVFLGWAAFYLVSALFAIKNFAWRQPMFDQWRMYQTLLTKPFPQNVVELESGHRPIIPNLIRLAETRWFSADQLLQIGIGIGCAIASVFLIVAIAWRDDTLPFSARAAVTMLAIVGIFWLANARMLMHGNEALHAYLVVLAVICAGLSTYRARQTLSTRWMFVVSAWCVVAMFCFGPGVACFPAVIVLGWLLRIPYRKLAIPAVVLVACLIVYLYALPGNEGVRGMLLLKPWTSMELSMAWLSSPWATGWLSLADPPIYPLQVQSFLQNSVGSALVTSANAIVGLTHLSWSSLSMLIGFGGTLLFTARILHVFIKRQTLTILQALAIMLCLFALATAFLIGVVRFDYFATYPDQLFADRYLIWPSLFWCGLALLLVVDVMAARNRWVIAAGCAFVLVLPITLLPTHSNLADWAAAVYRNAQRLAAAARSGAIDPVVIEGNADDIEQYRTTVAMFRERNLAMFADTSWQLLGSRWSGSLERDSEIVVDEQPMKRVDAPSGAAAAGHFDGVFTQGIDQLPHGGELMVLDEDDRIIGFAEFSYLGVGSRSLIFSSPHKRGFDGYATGLDQRTPYRLAWLDTKSNRGILLAEIAPP